MEAFTRIFRTTTADRSFTDLQIPATVMTANLAGRCPAPISTGPLWEALMAALAIPGLYPPWIRGEERLVDAVSLTPVPLGSVVEAGADITIAVTCSAVKRCRNGRMIVAISRYRISPRSGAPYGSGSARARATRRQRAPDCPRRCADYSTLRSGNMAPHAPWRLFFTAGQKAAEAQLSLLGMLARPSTGAEASTDF